MPADQPRALNERRASARVDPELARELLGTPGLIHRAARLLAAEHFPDAEIAPVLAALGLPEGSASVPRRPEDRPRRRRVGDLDAYLRLTLSDAREQYRELLVRSAAPEGSRQVPFIPVETLLCLAASFVINHRRYGGSTAHTAGRPVPELAGLFKRPPSSILAKMANLDGSRSHGASNDASVRARLVEDPTLFTHVYRVLMHAARAEGIAAKRLPDFLDLEDGGELDLLGQDEIADLAPDDLRPEPEGQDPDPETERLRLVAARVAQHHFARNVLANCAQACVFCGLRPSKFGARRMLLAGHIKPWRDCAPGERLDTRNGLAACPSHDVAFDVGLLTVRDTLEIVLSERFARFVKDDELAGRYYGRPTLSGFLLFPEGAQRPLHKYLDWHRRYIFADPWPGGR